MSTPQRRIRRRTTHEAPTPREGHHQPGTARALGPRARRVAQSAVLIAVLGGLLAQNAAHQEPREAPTQVSTAPVVITTPSDPDPRVEPTRTAPPATPKQIAAQDAEEDDPANPERLHRERALRAFQALPWQAAGVTIDIAPAPMRGGRMVLVVAYQPPLTKAQARGAYTRFLAIHRDTGRAYVPLYMTWDEYRGALCEVNQGCRLP